MNLKLDEIAESEEVLERTANPKALLSSDLASPTERSPTLRPNTVAFGKKLPSRQ
jgi:hypothetical protein